MQCPFFIMGVRWMHNTKTQHHYYSEVSLSLVRERVHARVRAPRGGKRRKLDEEDEDEETKKTLLATAFSSHRSLRDASY